MLPLCMLGRLFCKLAVLLVIPLSFKPKQSAPSKAAKRTGKWNRHSAVLRPEQRATTHMP